jgi:hypothetical protein
MDTLNINTSTGFRAYLWKTVCKAFENFGWWLDMLLATVLTGATLAIQVWLHLISTQDWKQHRAQWTISVVGPYVVVLVFDIARRFFLAHWRIYKDQEAAHAKREADLAEQLDAVNNERAELVAQQVVNRPYLRFDYWGQIPANHSEATPIAPTVAGQFLQNGFHLRNDGGPAHEVTVESFSVGEFTAYSKVVPYVGKEGGFALIWVAQPQHLQSPQSPGRWDLLGAVGIAAVHAHGFGMYSPDFSVEIFVKYRDANDTWYRSRANLTYIRSQNRLAFGAMTHEKPLAQVALGSIG